MANQISVGSLTSAAITAMFPLAVRGIAGLSGVMAGASAGPIGALVGAVIDINGQIAAQGFSVDDFGRTSPNYGWNPSNPTLQGTQ